jgi:hypothetical protein
MGYLGMPFKTGLMPNSKTLCQQGFCKKPANKLFHIVDWLAKICIVNNWK